MLNYLRKKLVQKHLSKLNNRLDMAFVKIDSDIKNLQGWISHTLGKHEDLHKDHHEHKSLTSGEIDQLKRWVNYLHDHSRQLREFVGELTGEVKRVQENQEKTLRKVEEIEKKIAHKQTATARPTFEDKVIRTHIRPNKKNYVIQEIMKLIGEGRHSTKQIEEIVVKEKGLCGRTTFYSHLKELRDKGKIGEANAGSRTILVENS